MESIWQISPGNTGPGLLLAEGHLPVHGSLGALAAAFPSAVGTSNPGDWPLFDLNWSKHFDR
jgi:hypothetical protein